MDYVKLDPYELNFDAYMCFQIFLVLGAIAFLIGVIWFWSDSKAKVAIRVLAVISLLLLGGGCIFAFFQNAEAQQEKVKTVKEHNEQASAANLLAKYDLQEVKWDSTETTADPKSTSGDGEILVKIRSGEKFIFKYRVDLETSEPFLEDMPFHGGSAPEKTVTAESLVK